MNVTPATPSTPPHNTKHIPQQESALLARYLFVGRSYFLEISPERRCQAISADSHQQIGSYLNEQLLITSKSDAVT